MNISIIEFPGSHGISEVEYALRNIMGLSTTRVWHGENEIESTDCVIIPSGMAFGDLIRPGALCKVARIAPTIRKFAKEGLPIIGFGNGFQILCELDILPGSFLRNLNASYLNSIVCLKATFANSSYIKMASPGSIFRLPLVCNWGRYYADPRTLVNIEENDQIAFQFCDEDGDIQEDKPFNGATKSIAGLFNKQKNVLGLIAHPERAVDSDFGGLDGLSLLKMAFESCY